MKKLLSLTVVFLAWTMIMCQGSENLKNFQKASANECGHRNINGLLTKLSGDENQAKYGEFPWIVNILNEGEDGDSHACIGSIIHPNVILTVAQCVHGKAAETLKVRAGEWDKHTDSEIFPVQDRYVAEIIEHKNFKKGKPFNNIALLILTKPFQINESVKLKCLTPPDTQLDYQRCVVTGCVETSLNGLYQSNVTKINLTVITRIDCESASYETYNEKYWLEKYEIVGPFSEVYSLFMCTPGIVGENTCDGFVGAPLVCPIVGTNDRYALVGMVAWSIRPEKINLIGYVNITYLKSWITEQLANQYIVKALLEQESTKPKSEKCEYQHINGLGCELSENHNESKYEKFPWMVSLFTEMSDSSNIHLCGGSVIRPYVILTAAHCVYDVPENQLKVRAGEWDVQNGFKEFSIQRRNVSKVILHKNFKKDSLFNDIALLILSTPLEFNENVNSICLPTTNTLFDYQRCVVTGWGKTSLNDLYQWTLTKIDLTVITNDECQSAFRRTERLGPFFKLDSPFICTAGKYTCDVFGGSPLVCPIVGTNDRYAQVGLVAWGIGYTEVNPTAYLNICNLKSWIDDQLKVDGIDGASFTTEPTNNKVIGPKKKKHVCGLRKINGISPDSGEIAIQIIYEEFPWMVMVLTQQKVKDGLVDIYQCAGSIIREKAVLVTAQCVKNKTAETLKVKVGEWNTQDNIDRYVSNIIVHENYTKNDVLYNIALLILTEPIEFNENVYPICLPTVDKQFENQKCLVTGWGKNIPNDINDKVNLMEIDVTVISRDQCQSTLRSIQEKNVSEFYLHPSLICTEGKFGNDTRMEYIGSPLLCPMVGAEDRYYQAGLFTSDSELVKLNLAIYVNIADIFIWIEQTLNQMNK